MSVSLWPLLKKDTRTIAGPIESWYAVSCAIGVCKCSWKFDLLATFIFFVEFRESMVYQKHCAHIVITNLSRVPQYICVYLLKDVLRNQGQGLDR